MSRPIIEVENLSKLYRLGSIGAGTFQDALKRRWAHLLGRDDPLKKVGEKELMIPADHPQAGPEPNTFWALKDVSFSVEEGEVLGIIGKNGAGKSTLLKVLSRITEPTEGRITMRGRVASLLEVGTGFHPELTGRENVYLNGAILGMRRREIEAKFDEIVAFSEVERFIDTPVKRYSSGMYVRLAFAVAAHLEPEILIVDEVLAVGDAEFQKKCLGKMGEVAGQGRTVLFVSHNMQAVQRLCRKANLLEKGRLCISGSASDVVSHYLSSSETGAHMPLARRTDREGSGSVRITELQVFSRVTGDAFVASGESVEFALTYESRAELEAPTFHIAIYDQYGVQLAHLSTLMVGYQLQALGNHGTLVCSVPSFPLAPGPYCLNVAVMDKGVVVDRVVNAAILTVEDGDFFESGNQTANRWGRVLVQHSWCQQMPGAAVKPTLSAESS